MKKFSVATAASVGRKIGFPLMKRRPDGHTVAQATLALMLDRSLLGAHAAEEERREEKRGRVGQEGEGSAESLHEQAAERGARDGGDGAAAVDERVSLQVALARGQRDEQRRIREVEEHGERPGEEGDRIELHERERIQRVGERNRGGERRPPQVGRDHDPASARDPVEPDAGRKREEEMREERGRAQEPHLPGPASRTRTATSGSASTATWSPRSEIDWASQKLRNSRSRRSVIRRRSRA